MCRKGKCTRRDDADAALKTSAASSPAPNQGRLHYCVQEGGGAVGGCPLATKTPAIFISLGNRLVRCCRRQLEPWTRGSGERDAWDCVSVCVCVRAPLWITFKLKAAGRFGLWCYCIFKSNNTIRNISQ